MSDKLIFEINNLLTCIKLEKILPYDSRLMPRHYTQGCLDTDI